MYFNLLRLWLFCYFNVGDLEFGKAVICLSGGGKKDKSFTVNSIPKIIEKGSTPWHFSCVVFPVSQFTCYFEH